MSSPEAQTGFATLAARFAARFPEALRGPRTIGREAEHPVVREDGSAGEVAELWAPLAEGGGLGGGDLDVKREGDLIVQLDGPRYQYAAEVGRGTIEVITGPCPDLHALRDAHEEAMARLVRAADRCGFRVLGYGIQPLSPAERALMTPKQRYGVLLEVIGDLWLWFALTASDQVQIDIARHEVVPLTNLCNLLAPATVALCANSPVYTGRESGFASAREGRMGEIRAEDGRHGMPLGPYGDLTGFVERLSRQPFFMEKRDGVMIPFGRPFQAWLAEVPGTDEQRAFEQYLVHEHYIWNSARPRSAHATIELRAACQQPWEEHMAAAALGLSMVEAGSAIASFVRSKLGPDPWPAMRAWHPAVIRLGLDAPEPCPGLLAGILERCRDALEARGRGEERYLHPIVRRLADRANPARRALDAMRSGGMAALVAHAAIPAEVAGG